MSLKQTMGCAALQEPIPVPVPATPLKVSEEVTLVIAEVAEDMTVPSLAATLHRHGLLGYATFLHVPASKCRTFAQGQALLCIQKDAASRAKKVLEEMDLSVIAARGGASTHAPILTVRDITAPKQYRPWANGQNLVQLVWGDK